MELGCAMPLNITEVQRAWAGGWRNEKGSLLTINSVLPIDDRLGGVHLEARGTFNSAIGQVRKDAMFPFSGYIGGNRIAFTVFVKTASMEFALHLSDRGLGGGMEMF